jgi:hypothetical protein
MSASTDPARLILLSHRCARYHVHGAALPHPTVDPNPRLTFALHNIWARAHKYFTIDQEGTPRFLPSDKVTTGDQFFSVIFNELVSLIVVLLIFIYLSVFVEHLLH